MSNRVMQDTDKQVSDLHSDVSIADHDIAVILPCFNEEIAVAQTVEAFRSALPSARVYVFDNNSTDATASRAAQAGASVGYEMRPGKGNVIRRMFADVDADVYVLADGDATYDATAAPKMIARLITSNLDMVTGARLSRGQPHSGPATGSAIACSAGW